MRFYPSDKFFNEFDWLEEIFWDLNKEPQLALEQYISLSSGWDLYVNDLTGDMLGYSHFEESIFFELEVSEVYP